MVPPFGKIVEAFRQTWYEILGPAQPVEVEEPHAIHRVIKTRAHGKEILVDDISKTQTSATSSCYLSGPKITSGCASSVSSS